MKHTELRCGNLHEYYIEDKHDERKAWWEVSVIDWNDLRYLEEHPEDNFYRFIPLSEQWLIRAGFKKHVVRFSGADMWQGMDGWSLGDSEWIFRGSPESGLKIVGFLNTDIRYVHQLQNAFHVISSGEELTFKDIDQ